MLSIYFLNYLLNKIINYIELLLFDIYLTYNLQVIWKPLKKDWPLHQRGRYMDNNGPTNMF